MGVGVIIGCSLVVEVRGRVEDFEGVDIFFYLTASISKTCSFLGLLLYPIYY